MAGGELDDIEGAFWASSGDTRGQRRRQAGLHIAFATLLEMCKFSARHDIGKIVLQLLHAGAEFSDRRIDLQALAREVSSQ